MAEGDLFDKQAPSSAKTVPLSVIDLLAMHPNIKPGFGGSEIRQYWESLLRVHGWDKMAEVLKGLPFNSTIDDVRAKLCGESSGLQERVVRALARRGAVSGTRQAKQLIGLVECQGACHTHEETCDCLYWIFCWQVRRSIITKWPTDYIHLITEWKECGRPKQPKVEKP